MSERRMTDTGKVKHGRAVFNWAGFDALTVEQVLAAAKADTDAPPLTKAELARMRPATPVRRPVSASA